MITAEVSQPTKPATRTVRPGRRRRRWMQLGGGIVALLLVAGFFYRRACDPVRIRARVEAALQGALNARIALGSADFSWVHGVRVYDLRIDRVGTAATQLSRSAVPDADGAILICRELRATKPWWSWLTGNAAVDALVAIEPMVTISPQDTPLEELIGLIRAPSAAAATSSIPLNTLELRRARLRLRTSAHAAAPFAEDLIVTVRARRSTLNPSVLDVVWQDERDRFAEGRFQVLSGEGQVRHVEGGSPWMSAHSLAVLIGDRRAPFVATLAESLRGGRIRAADFRLAFRGDAEASSFATLEIRGLAASLPPRWSPDGLSLPGAPLLHDGRGQITWKPGGVDIDLTGEYDHARLSLRGEASFRSGAAPSFEISADVTDLSLPPRDRFDPAFAELFERSRVLQTLYREVEPVGLMNAQVQVAKAPLEDAPWVVRKLVLTARGVNAVYRRVPYPLEGLTGIVEYTPEEVLIRGLAGRRGETTVKLEGRVSVSPTSDSPDRIDVHAIDVPIDDALWGILPASMASLRSELSPRGGMGLDLTAIGTREDAAANRSWGWEALAHLRDVSMAGPSLPQPVEKISGTLRVSPGRVEFLNVAGDALSGRVHADGVVEFDAGGPTSVRGEARATGVQIDAELVAGLPEGLRKHLVPLHPSGRVDVSTVLTLDTQNRTFGHDTEISLRDVSFRPQQLPITFEGAAGRVLLTHEEVRLDGITAKQGDATWSAEGAVQLTGEHSVASLILRGRNVHMTDELRDALRPRLGAPLDELRLDGAFDLQTTLHGAMDGAALADSAHTTIRFHDAMLGHSQLPLPISGLTGELVIQAGRIAARDLEGRYGPAMLRLTFDAGAPEAGVGGLHAAGTLSVVGLPVDDSVRGLLSSRLRGEWDRVRPGGTVDVDLEQVTLSLSDGNAAPTIEAFGRVRLQAVKLPGLLDIADASGEITGGGIVVDPTGATSLRGELRLSSLDLLRRRVEQARGQWGLSRSTDKVMMLDLRSAQGTIYDGRAMADAGVVFSRDPTRYQAAVRVHGMQIKPFLDAGRGDREPTHVEGLLNGQLYISGIDEDVGSRRGGGRFEIGGGRIQQLPIIVAIVQVLNLSIPDERMIDHARGEFLIAGPRVQVEQIRLDGGGLVLEGSGTMSLPDRIVDLSFVQNKPPKWAVLPGVAELVNAATRELIEIRVTGSVDRPTVRTIPLGGLRNEVRSLFQPKKPN